MPPDVDVGVVVKHVLDAVAVVDAPVTVIPVEYENLAADVGVVGLAHSGGDGHVAEEESEANGPVELCVMPGW